MPESLSVKYRPKEFNELIGQSSIVKILERQINTQQYKHAYLFTGGSGLGKTTIARILASKINGSLIGVEEIDAASNNGVENMRNIIKSARERSLNAKYKIFIIDEVHALTGSSWNALLKTLEEPPEYTIFMLCTTDPQKIPPTIANRCQRYNLSKISTDKLIERLDYICRQEGYTNYQESIEYIAKISNGGARDAIATLEKVASFDTNMSMEKTLQALGNYSYAMFFKLVNDIIDSNQAEVLKTINDIYKQGSDLKLFVDEFFKFCLDITKFCLFRSTDLLDIPNSQLEALNLSTNFDNAEKYYIVLVDKLMALKTKIKSDTSIKSTIEATFLNMARWE